MLNLRKFTLGVGDRFAHQARPQLRACMLAADQGVEVVPVWNKSNREHSIVGSEPGSARAAADEAVRELGWKKPYHVDADHINLTNVERFLDASDFYTLDVADAIGKPADAADLAGFVDCHEDLAAHVDIAGLSRPFESSRAAVSTIASKYLYAVQEASRIYRRIERAKGEGNFITEVSMDETDSPQSPAELLVILAALADEGIPVQTIAPKFTGRFNKGVDYVGDPAQFEREFRDDIAVIAYAVKNYGLPANLKLSVHSGSDKFSIYGGIHRALAETGAGVHIKTAGSNWLEELIGLAETGGEGLDVAKDVYQGAYEHLEEMCAPYATVIDVDPARLPTPEQVRRWSGEQYAATLRHDSNRREFNPDFRQLLHVGYKIAAAMGDRYIRALEACEPAISRNVTDHLFRRHIRPIFIG
ncbi:MAG TPA: tagaturonate epimerase family protein [Bryobacteraceae bacterium]|nr:tagaturonate epimerase family protein [Bryobacteraceae bacterium]